MNSLKIVEREELIRQLRYALHMATSPKEDIVEFTVGDLDFEFDYSGGGK